MTEDELHEGVIRMFAVLQQRGEPPTALLELVRTHGLVARKVLDKLLLNTVLRTPEEWAQFQAAQGAMQAINRLWEELRTLAQPEAPQRSRPDPAV